MGFAVSVSIQGEEESPYPERVDAKFLGDIVGGWIAYPETTSRLRLTPTCTAALLRVDSTAYGGDPSQAADAWQDPTALRAAVEELRAALKKIPRGRLGRLAWSDVFIDLDELDDYDIALEDVARVCEWAIQKGRRVALEAW